MVSLIMLYCQKNNIQIDNQKMITIGIIGFALDILIAYQIAQLLQS